MRQKYGDTIVGTRVVDGTEVVIYGCWDEETPEGQYDYYDLYVDGECINMGSPCWMKPTDQVIKKHLDFRKEVLQLDS